MANLFPERIIVSIDVGTTKICVLVGRHVHDDYVEIVGIGKAPSHGLRKGVVVDIAKTIQSIQVAVKEAELMAGMQIESAYVGISGGHIRSVNSHGVVPLKRGEVHQIDIDNVIAAARAIPVPEGQQILHVLPQYFVIDSQDQVEDPLGMHGIRLEVEAHIILGAVASVQNLVKCCEMAGVKVIDVVLEQLASADAVLSVDERELGVGVLDIGGGTSDFAIYQHGNIRHTMVLPVAGMHFTNDLAVGLRTTLHDAERVKVAYGLACIDLLKEEELIEVDMVQGDKTHIVQQSELVAILEPRAREILTCVHREVTKHKLLPSMTAGLVLTGGGSLLRGFKDVAERIFSVPIRIGNPHMQYQIPDLLRNPMYATGYGLIMYVVKKNKMQGEDVSDGSITKRIVARMKSWVSDFF